MAKVIFTPWKEHSQLLTVRSQFYPPPAYDGPDMRSNACATVGSWKLRGNLPHPVEATALLTDAILHDDATKNSIFSIRATYSAAFCRFVTGLVDSKLHGQKRTMFQRAMDLGLPASFVELRHEATHRELPSLIVLRNAAQRSLEWLWGYYWVKIDRDAVLLHRVPEIGVSDDDVLVSVKAVIRDALKQAEVVEDGEPPRKKRKSRHYQQSSIATQLVSVCKASSKGAFAVSRILLEDSILVPAKRKLGDSLDDLFPKWEHLLQMVIESHPAFLTALTEEMINELAFTNSSNSKDDAYREAIYMWLDHILKSTAWQTTRRLLSPSYILTACDKSPNYWTKLLKADLQKQDSGESLFFTMPDFQVSKNGRLRSMNGVKSENAEEALNDSYELAQHGWQVLDKWDCRPLGVA